MISRIMAKVQMKDAGCGAHVEFIREYENADRYQANHSQSRWFDSPSKFRGAMRNTIKINFLVDFVKFSTRQRKNKKIDQNPYQTCQVSEMEAFNIHNFIM